MNSVKEAINMHFECIVAEREGVAIQTRAPGPSKWYTVIGPEWRLDREYRIKPLYHTRWINVYPRGMVSSWGTKEIADAACIKADSAARRIACIEVTYEEGEGL